MKKFLLSMKFCVVLTIVVAALVPIISHIWVIGRVPSVTAAEAMALVNAEGSRSVLVDVRTPEEFDERRIKKSFNWPCESIQRGDALPGDLRGKQLLMLCNSGILSAVATQWLHDHGNADVLNVRDGIRSFNMLSGKPLVREKLTELFEGAEPVPYRVSPFHEQLALSLTGFFVKPAYMLLSFVLTIVLWRGRAADLVALKWALIFFLAGEPTCRVRSSASSSG